MSLQKKKDVGEKNENRNEKKRVDEMTFNSFSLSETYKFPLNLCSIHQSLFLTFLAASLQQLILQEDRNSHRRYKEDLVWREKKRSNNLKWKVYVAFIVTTFFFSQSHIPDQNSASHLHEAAVSRST